MLLYNMNDELFRYLESQESLVPLSKCPAINNYPHKIIVNLCENIAEKVQKYLNTSELPALISLSNGYLNEQGLWYREGSKGSIVISVLDFDPEKSIEKMGSVVSKNGEKIEGLKLLTPGCHLRLGKIYTGVTDYNSEFSGIFNRSKRNEMKKARSRGF